MYVSGWYRVLYWMPPQRLNFQFPTLDNNIMAEVRTSDIGTVLGPLSLVS
jgi:hypothetical protein